MPPAQPGVLDDRFRRFLDVPRVAALATVAADGAPAQAVIWFRLDPDGTILVNSRLSRRWPTELLRSRRASLAVVDERDGMRWLGLSCTVGDVVDDVAAARADIVALAHRYDDAAPETIATFMSQQRISFRLRVDAIHDHLGAE